MPTLRSTIAVLVAVVLCGGLLAPAQAANDPAPVVVAGSLRVLVQPDPWQLDLVDAAGRSVLSETSGGALGFRTAAGWQHATRVSSSKQQGGAYEAVLETTDPLRQISLRLAPGGEGTVALDARVTGAELQAVDAVGMGFDLEASERFLGFGERSNAVDQRGGVIENYVSDGPYQPEEYPFLNAFVPPWGLREGRLDATYYPVPWLLSTRGYGVLVDDPQTSYFRLDGEDAWSVEVVRAPEGEAAPTAAPPDRLQLRFFGGPTPADALRRFTAATGRQPQPQPWAFGSWFQARGDEAEALRSLRTADVPVSVLQTYLHYLPCGEQVGVEDQQPGRTAAAHALGVAITTYFNPMVCANYADGYDPSVVTQTPAGQPFLYRYGASPEDSNLVGQYDFFRPEGVAAFGERLEEAIGHGYDGWMEDFGEYTPLDSVSGDGIDGSRAHNPYATAYHCAAAREARSRSTALVRFQRSGWTGSAACADVVWGGDPTTGWGYDGLRSAVRQALSMGTSGVSTWGSDVGGFFAIGRNALSPEMLTRWVQMGALSPVMRTQANGVALPSKDRPQVTDPAQLANWRRWSKLHTQLFPYLTAASQEYGRSGMPIVRSHALVSPADPAAARDDQYLFGPDLLAAPVLDPDVRSRDVVLPRGQWVDLWRSAAPSGPSLGLRLGRASLLAGGRTVAVPAPLEQAPLLVRAGAVLPLLPADVDTLASFGTADPSIVHLADRADRLELLAFPRGSSRSALPDGGALVSTEGKGRWTLEVRDDVRRSYALQASLGTLAQPFAPCRVLLDGRALPRSAWSYDAADRSLRASFTARSGLLAVAGCASAPAVATGSLPATGPAVLPGALGLLSLLTVLVVRRRS